MGQDTSIALTLTLTLTLIWGRTPPSQCPSSTLNGRPRTELPWLGTLASFGEGKDVYHFFRDSVTDFPQPEEFSLMLNKAGFEVTSITNYAYGVVQHFQAVKVAERD